MQNSMVVFTFSVFDQKYPFWINFVQKVKLVSLRWNFEYAEFNECDYFFCFWSTLLFLGKFGPKIQNCWFKLKFSGLTNSNMQNSMVEFTFSVFNQKYPFWASLVQKYKIISLSLNLLPWLIRIYRIQWWCSLSLFSTVNTFLGKFSPKNQNYQFKLKFSTGTNSNMHNSMVIFIFSVFDRKYPFWANLVQKIKLVNLSWNLIPILILIFRIQWWCSLFLILTENAFFN